MSSHFNVKQPATYRSSRFDVNQPATDFTSHFSFKHPTTDSSSHFNISQPATIKSLDVVNCSITKQAVTVKSSYFNVKTPCHVQWNGYASSLWSLSTLPWTNHHSYSSSWTSDTTHTHTHTHTHTSLQSLFLKKCNDERDHSCRGESYTVQAYEDTRDAATKCSRGSREIKQLITFESVCVLWAGLA